MTDPLIHDESDHGQSVTIGAGRMLRRRLWLTLLCVVVVVGSVAPVLGYGLYLRSDRYRQSLERELGDRLGLTMRIAGVRPLTHRSRLLEDVAVYLEPGGAQVFSCKRITWTHEDHDAGPRYVLTLSDGWLLAGETDWTTAEYRRMLAGGFGHDFSALGVAEVRLHDIDLRFRHGLSEMSAGRTRGWVLFDSLNGNTAEGSLTCLRINGETLSEPANIAVRFTPGRAFAFQDVRVSVPSLSLATLGVEHFLGHPVRQGQFEGTIGYRGSAAGDTVEIQGALHDADLAELTAAAPGGPFRGRLDIDLDRVLIENRRLRYMDLHGYVGDLILEELLPALGSEDAPGLIALRIDALRWRDGAIEYLSASGSGEALSLNAVTGLLGHGVVTGTATAAIRSLMVVNDELKLVDVVVEATPPPSEPGLIHREVVAQLGERWLGADLRVMLPEFIEYARLGARMVIEGRVLRIHGTHGPDGRTILTGRLFHRDVPLLKAPRRTFEVPDILGMIRGRAESVTGADVRHWWERLRETPTDADRRPKP